MTESKHTPGPWAFEVNVWGSILSTDYGEAENLKAGRAWDEDISIAANVDWDVIGEEEIAANARLIAAAPELLEALEETLIVATRNEDGDFADRARAAIAKAKGDA
ncbi:hypothetical protein [Pseudohoeflea coraliihabitans]|uniref:Uncharacterized protein n=1 Tax=Pseudohoeflea coraliihabitans TaxID=2860393 RepID=A0ABS6WLL3_9HYPH|nr:hypothetical protein [Pseudohoeflea sp. DP4N28-3]MBW3096846.1 hypothetical protein [Pseudohoeflea sp. DP4N28-3]